MLNSHRGEKSGKEAGPANLTASTASDARYATAALRIFIGQLCADAPAAIFWRGEFGIDEGATMHLNEAH